MKSTLRTSVVFLLTALVINARAEKPKPFVFTPTNGTGPFPVALWLHGYRGYSPAGYMPGATHAAMQKHADILGAVIVGFPGTHELADGTQEWTEDPVTDQDYIQSRLREIGKDVKLNFSRVALFGFSQGAKIAAELASRYPENYMGALAMSPGGFEPPKIARVKDPRNEKQVYFFFCGAEEHPANVGLTRAYAKHLETVLGAKVTLKLYPGVSKHARPADFMEKFPEWMGAILKVDPKQKP